MRNAKRLLFFMLIAAVIFSMFPVTGIRAGEGGASPVLQNTPEVFYSPVKISAQERYQMPDAAVATRQRYFNVMDAREAVLNDYAGLPADQKSGIIGYLNKNNYSAKFIMQASGGYRYTYNATGTIPDVIDCTEKYNFGARFVGDFGSIPALYKAAHKGDLQFAAPLFMYSLYEKYGNNDEALYNCTGMSGTFRLYQTGRWVPFNWDGKNINTFYPFVDSFYQYFSTAGESESYNRAAFTGMEVYLKDVAGPKIESVDFSTKDPLSGDPGFTNKFNLTTEYAYVSLNFDEHVKFRDSYATESNMENLKSLKINLPTIIDGITGGAPVEASFYKLAPSTDGKFTRMIFKYKIPQNQEFRIQSIVMDAATNNNLFSNITDLAGNAFAMPKGSSSYLPAAQTYTIGSPAYIDTISPSLGSPEIGSDVGVLRSYATLTLTLNFSERMKIVGSEAQNVDNKAIVADYGGVKNVGVITNIYDPDGNRIVLNSNNAYRKSVVENKKVGSLNGKEVTSITYQFAIPSGAYITEDYVKVLGLVQYKNGQPLPEVTLEDTVDNPIDLTKAIQAPNNQFVLDTYAPVVKAEGPLSYDNNAPINGETGAKKEFYFKVTVNDSLPGKKSSTVNGQTGTFYLGLLQGSSYLTSDTYGYKVTETADKPDPGSLLTTPNGTYITFPEDKTTYIHIKLKDAVDIENIDIRTSANDQAGNTAKTATQDGSNVHKYVLDSMPPEVSIIDKGVTTENGVRKFYARFSAQDDRGNMKAYGLWQDASVTTAPTNWSSATVITATYGPLLIVDRFTLNLEEGQQYAKKLWIKVTDLQNSTILSVPGFALDLRTPVFHIQPVVTSDQYMTGIPQATVTSDVYNTTLYYQWIVNDKISGDYYDDHPEWDYYMDIFQNGTYQNGPDSVSWNSVPISNHTGPVTLTFNEPPLFCYSGWWFKAVDPYNRDTSRFPYDTEILLYVRSGQISSPDRISVTRFKLMNSSNPYGTGVVLGKDHIMKPILTKLDIADDKEAKLAAQSVMDFTNGYQAKGYIDAVKNIYGMDMIDFDSEETYFEVAKVIGGQGAEREISLFKEKLKKTDLQKTDELQSWEWYTRYRFSYSLPASLFKEDSNLNNYLFRLSVKPKSATNVGTGATVSYTPILYTVTNVIADSHNVDKGSLIAVKNHKNDTELLREYAYGTASEEIFVGGENPAITFRTLSGYFEGPLDTRSGMVEGSTEESSVPNVALRFIANPVPGITPTEDIFTAANVPWTPMAVNKAINDSSTSVNYKYFDYTVNSKPTPDFTLNQGKNVIYYQFIGATGVKSPISKIVIHVESTPPQIFFSATPRPDENRPEFTTKEPVVAQVSYVVDSHIDPVSQTEITDTSPSLIKVVTQGILDTGAAILPGADGKYTFPSNGRIIATATDGSGNTTTKELHVNRIDTQKPEITSAVANADAPVSILASAHDNGRACKLYAAFDSAYEEYLNGKDTGPVNDTNRSWFEVNDASLLPGVVSSTRTVGTNEVSFSFKAYSKYDKENKVTPKTVYLKAVDGAGNESDIKAISLQVVNTKPEIVRHSYSEQDGYTLEFTVPVQLKNMTSSANGASAILHKNVNIFTNGSYTIEYADSFLQLYSSIITARVYDDSYTHTIALSNSRPTHEPVKVTISTPDGSGLYIKIDDIVGKSGSSVTKDGIRQINGQQVCSAANVTFGDNDEFSYTLMSADSRVLPKTVKYKVTNIDGVKPTAVITRQVLGYEYEDNGTNFVAGSVKYDISGFDEPNVTILSDSGMSYTFKEKGSYTFRFVDEAGNESAMDISENSEFLSPDVLNDTTPPEYILSFYSSNASGPVELGRYDKAYYEELLRDNKLTMPYGNRDVIVNVIAKDDNAVTMTLMDGGTFASRVVGQDKLIFTQNGIARVELKDAKDNTTTIDIKVNCIDKEAPTGTVRYIVQTDKTVKAYLENISDNNSTAADCAVLPVNDIKYDDVNQQYYFHLLDNGTKSFQIMDAAGNVGTVAVVVGSIDLAKPEAVSVKWNPGKIGDESKPMTGVFTNANVKAFFTLSERIKSVDVKVVNPAGVADADTSDYVTYTFSETDLTLEFKKNAQISLTLTDFAGNVSNAILVPEDGMLTIIDKEAPILQISNDYTGPAKVGSVTYTFGSNEEVCFTSERNVDSEGKSIYQKEFSRTYTKNGIYTLSFADRAGNVTAKTITVSEIDTEAPRLTIHFKKENDLSGSERTNKSVQVEISADENCTIIVGKKNDIDKVQINYVAPASVPYTIENNGLFEIVVQDSFGNRATGNLLINFIDKNTPTITLTKNGTYEIAANSVDYNTLMTELMQGVTASDSEDGVIHPNTITVSGIDANSIKTPGSYTVKYTVKDGAGNEGTATRELAVYDPYTSFFIINGERLATGAVKIISGKTVTVVSPTVEGNYVMYCKKGWNTVAMMKNDAAQFTEGSFEVDSTGYYTVLIQSAERKTFIVYLYITDLLGVK